MDSNSEIQVHPVIALLFILIFAIGVAIIFLATGNEARFSKAATYFLEHDKQGNLSVQMDHMLMHFSPKGKMISSINLRDYGVADVMGNKYCPLLQW